MKLIIPEHADEKNFFSWLESISAVKRVVGGKGGKLQVTLKLPVSRTNMRDLTALLLRYDLDISCLNVLLTEENASWLHPIIDPARRSKIHPNKRP